MSQKYNFNDLSYFLQLKQLEKDSIFLIGDDIKIYKFPNQAYIVISKKAKFVEPEDIFKRHFGQRKQRL